jgi:hypothetical protein
MNKKLFPPLKNNPAKTLLQNQPIIITLLLFPKNPNKNDNKSDQP